MTDEEKRAFLADEGYSRSPVIFWSEGTRISGDVYRPLDATGQGPAVVLCHGFGGLKSQLAHYARIFAREGLTSLVFDYRGFGDSESRLISAPDAAMTMTRGPVETRAWALREVVDPIAHVEDLRAAFAFMLEEEGVDPARVGLWGSSYGGNHAALVTGTDQRVKALVSQVGSMFFPRSATIDDLVVRRAADKARARIDPPVPQDIDLMPALNGHPDFSRVYIQAADDVMDRIAVPTLVLDADEEELFPREQHGLRLHESVRTRAPARYRSYPGTHYQIYDVNFIPAVRETIAWFKEHL